MSKSDCDYEYKKSVIDAVQARINHWLPRPYTIKEALDLKGLKYPFSFKVMPIAISNSLFEQNEVQYDRLMHFPYTGNFEIDVENVWRYTADKYLSHVFGG